MKTVTSCLTVFLLMLLTLPAHGDDRRKSQKETRKFTAMATDATGRRIVSITMADHFGVKRIELVRQRRAMNLNYGSLFIAHELTRAGAKMLDIALRLHAGRTIWQVADEKNADWKRIANDAKKLNKGIDANLYQYFVDGGDFQDRDTQDEYRVIQDGVRADNDVSLNDVDEAHRVYQWWRERASVNRAGMLDTSTERAAYDDHVRNGGPQRSSNGTLAPAAGGLPPR